MGQVHLENIVARAAKQEIAFVALGDRHAPTLKTASRLAPGVPSFSSPEEMVAKYPNLDGVVISSQTQHHARDSLAFAQRGIPVLVEKRVCLRRQ
jgi:predicted dehydrogenase